ncbi:UNVERIFIED_CONTAM: protein RNA-directed DNA methylation 3 [Sesamum calycinum]|uniref:Protein RNA-directed DNA methylation 3 n=1 Tax=Sesamum calycinum TaxID=2727403 RepID=A0AAW2KU85_9LAMI
MVSAKGKEKVIDGVGKGKRKLNSGGDDDKTGRKRKNRGVLQFFEDAAYQVDEDEDSSDDSMFDDDFLDDEFGSEHGVSNEPGKVPDLPFIPKEEEMSEEELERMFEERYKPGAGFVTYAEDGDEHKKSVDRGIYVPSAKDSKIWKVKCMVGRERYSAFCLMQKYVDLEYLGTKLQIISACALDHVKGFIIIEAEKQNDIYEACKGLSTIYSSRVAAVPSNEISRLLSVRSKSSGISEGMWVRVKNGKYKGDLAQVVAVNDVRKKVTVKLVPRIDLKAMADKFGGGVTTKRTAIPAQRLISSSELEEFRPLIQFRRDRETNQMFEILDGMMLKDGYLYKKVSIDSLSLWGVMPTEDELLKFEPSKKDESTDVHWLSQLFGEKKKKEVQTVKKQDKGNGKSEGSSSASMGNNFEVHDLVFFGRKDFGVVIGSEKDDSVKVMKEGTEGPSVVTVKKNELKSASFDKKLFSVLDQHSNTLSVNDHVLVMDGPLKDRQGIVKKIYKGILFLCDESEQENNGYICVKAQLCEKVNLTGDASNEKCGEPGPSGFADLSSSPKSPLSPDKSLQERDNKSNFTRDDNGMFSVGQSLRIRVGPLKGYLCRVLAVRRSDVTVKLDSQQKILTVKSEHLSEVRGKNAITQSEESGSVKPFDFLGSQDGARDWMDGAALSTEGDKWNAGVSTERTSWSSFPSSNFSLPKESHSGDPVDDDAKKGAGDSSWQIKATPDQNSSWGAAAANQNMVSETGQLTGWGTSDGWGKPIETQQKNSGDTQKDDSWGRAAEKWSAGGDTSGSKAAWGQSGASSGKQTGGWANAGGDLDQPEASTWKNDSVAASKSKGGTWQGTAVADQTQRENWGNKKNDGGSEGGALSQVDVEAGGWTKSADKHDSQTKNWDTKGVSQDATGSVQTDSWSKLKSVEADCGPSWKMQDGKSWGKPDGGSSWGGESSWNTSGGKSAWGKQPDVDGDDKPKGWKDQNDHSGNTDGPGDQGFGGWKKGGMGNRDGQEVGWGRSRPFDAGRGSGGRRGRGEGRGGRGHYGRGRSFDQGQSTSWNKEDQYSEPGDARKNSSWGSDQVGGWGNSMSNEGSKKNDAWGKANASGKEEKSAWNQGCDANKDGDTGHGWGNANPNWGSKSGGWNISKGADSSNSSGWGKSSTANEQASAGSNGQDSWDKETKSNEDNKSSWNAATTSLDGNQSSDWSKGGNWGSLKASGEDSKSGGWNISKGTNSSNSSGWGKSSTANEQAGAATNSQDSWGKEKKPNEDNRSSWNAATTSLDGNQSSDWSKGGNWASRKLLRTVVGIRILQAMEKMGLVVRGRMKRMLMVVHQQDGVRVIGGKVKLEGIRTLLGVTKAIGTWETVLVRTPIKMTLLVMVEEVEAGEEAGEGEVIVVASEVEVGRIVVVLEVEVALAGGSLEVEEDLTGEVLVVEVDLKGRDFVVGVVLEAEDVAIGVTERDSENNLHQSWSTPKGDASQGGSWNRGDNDNNQHQGWSSSWNQPKGDASSSLNARAGGWNTANDSNKDAGQRDTGASGWGSSISSAMEVSTGWKKPEIGGCNNKSDWNQATAANNPGNQNTSGPTDMGKSKESCEVEGTADAWDKSAASPWEAPGNRNISENWKKPEISDGLQASASSKDEGPSDSWAKAATSSWGDGSGKSGW